MRTIALSLCFAFICNDVYADYFHVNTPSSKNYNFSKISIPESTGVTTNDVDGNAVYYSTSYSELTGGYIELAINGKLLGDGKTYATSNPGVGVQYTMHLMGTKGLSPTTDITEPPFRYTITGHTTPEGVGTGGTVNVWYRLVRITENVPAGEITSAPDVTLIVANVGGEGEALTTGTILSPTVQNQPKIVSCGIDAPTEIKLSPLYGNTITTGALNPSSAQSITLTNCPGAINGISYNFSAVYGTHKASNGVLNTVTGDGYAEGVYIQVQNADGSAHKVNGDIALSEYDGSGDYTLPDFKVAYFVDDANSVRPGNVKSAIEIKLSYN